MSLRRIPRKVRGPLYAADGGPTRRDRLRALVDSIADEIGDGRPGALHYALVAARKQLGPCAPAPEAFRGSEGDLGGRRLGAPVDAAVLVA